MTAGDIYRWLDGLAPFDSAEEWDNPGLLIGSPEDPVEGVLAALDVTPGAVDAAIAVGAGLILTHHPVIFSPLRRLERGSLPYRLAAAGIGVICAHTNLDRAAGGVNDVLVERLGLEDVCTAPDGLCRIGRLPAPMSAAELARLAGKALGAAVRVNDGAALRTLAVCGGSGGEYIETLAGVADAFLTGEVKHHQWLAANAEGLTVIEAGHHATEQPVIAALCRQLEAAFPTLSVTAYDGGTPYTTL